MQKDVRLGLILAAAVALACGWKRFGGGDSAKAGDAPAGPLAAITNGGRASQSSPPPVLELPSTLPDGVKQDQPTKPAKSNALAPVFPKDLRKSAAEQMKPVEKADLPELSLPGDLEPAAANEAAPTKQSATIEDPPTQKKSEAKSPPPLLALPDDDATDKPADERPPVKSPPKPESDKPKKPSSTKEPSAKGPVHPYFQRFIDSGTYFVRDGDSLPEIARNLYQDESMAGEIIKCNRNILKKPTDLKPGMKLELPKKKASDPELDPPSARPIG